MIRPPQEELINIPKEATEAASVLERLLENQLIGIYLYGSSVLGGLHVNSDVDILALCKESLSEEIRGKLTKELMRISGKVGCRSKRPLEVTLINEQAIIPWQFPPKYDYMYGEWLREELEAGVIPQANEDPDVAILLWQARQYSYTLKGPQITEVTPLIPMEDVQRAIEGCLPHLVQGVKGDERNVLLTLARMWFTLETGEIMPKDKATEWVCEKLPQNLRPLLETARKAYLGEYRDQWSELDAEVDDLVQFMRQSIEGMLDESI
ncbi:MAG: aminoglycoside adenylyltransferase family protein [Cellulosilyticaceae bacterium]